METKRKGPECLPRSVHFCFHHVKFLRVHRSLVRSPEYFQSREKVDFLGSSRPTLCQCFLNPSGQVGLAALALGPNQRNLQCLYRANASPSEGLLAVVWRHNRLIA